MEGDRGAGAVRETGEERAGRRNLYDGGKRERNSKRQAFAICYCILPVKETSPGTFLDFHLTFSELTAKFYTKIRARDKKKRA